MNPHTPKAKEESDKDNPCTSLVHMPHVLSSSKFEDMASSIGVVIVSMVFLTYVVVISNFPNILTKSNSQIGTEGPQVGIFTAPVGKVDCKKLDGNHNACVQAQISGGGCSWYARCDKCIVGSHDGKSEQEICGQ